MVYPESECESNRGVLNGCSSSYCSKFVNNNPWVIQCKGTDGLFFRSLTLWLTLWSTFYLPTPSPVNEMGNARVNGKRGNVSREFFTVNGRGFGKVLKNKTKLISSSEGHN